MSASLRTTAVAIVALATTLTAPVSGMLSIATWVEFDCVNSAGLGLYKVDGYTLCMVPTSSVRSVQVKDEPGCKYTSWSGRNCQGSSEDLPGDDSCVNRFFGSVSLHCEAELP